jgi:hydrogenase maturation protein HypF
MVDSLVPFNTSIVCITADGFGYGEDGNAWGGEVLVGGLSDYERKGGLMIQKYTGGDLSAVYSSRALIGILGNELESEELLQILESAEIAPGKHITPELLRILLQASDKEINIVRSTSAGRVLDAVAVALGVANQNSYDGECPMKLEALAKETDLRLETEFVQSEYGPTVDTTHLLKQVIDLRNTGVSRPDLAYAAQWSLGYGLAEIACDVASDEGLIHVGFSGGVAVNRIITHAIVDYVRNQKLVPLLHSLIPPGDGGVSVGQVATAAARLVEET